MGSHRPDYANGFSRLFRQYIRTAKVAASAPGGKAYRQKIIRHGSAWLEKGEALPRTSRSRFCCGRTAAAARGGNHRSHPGAGFSRANERLRSWSATPIAESRSRGFAFAGAASVLLVLDQLIALLNRAAPE